MKSIILYYSYTGSSKAFAEELAQKVGADLEEIHTVKRPGTVSAYVLGSFAAMRQKTVPIRPIRSDMNGYDRVILVAPIWANCPAPAFNSMVDLVPKKTNVELYFLSGGGSSGKEKITAYVKGKGLTIAGYHDVKQGLIQ